MRLTSDMFVSALLRRVNAGGGFGAVLRRGNREAGAIFVLDRRRTGETVLYGPAPQMLYDETKPADRMFTEILLTTDTDEVSARLEKEARFDSDIWAVEVETGGTAIAELITIAPE